MMIAIKITLLLYLTFLPQLVSSQEGCLCLEEFARDLKTPLILVSPPDGTCRIFVGEQKGSIFIYSNKGVKVKEKFLDLTDVVFNSDSRDERGFLGLAFHPNFETNGKFYVYYSREDKQKNHNHISRVSEFTVLKQNSRKADRNSERIIIEVPEPFSNHNAGGLLFDPEGYLLIFLGDGGSANDPNCNGQNRKTLLGSLLRVDVNTMDGYKIPKSNPYTGHQTFRQEIFAYGLRNPWRTDIDEGDPITGEGKGRIFAGDVGQGSFEEINIVEKGKNYGWNIREGFECFTRASCDKCPPKKGVNLEAPIHAYGRDIGRAVVGGHVYRGCRNPSWNGQYFYADFASARLFHLKPNGKNWDNEELFMCSAQKCQNKGLTNSHGRFILSFGEDYNGEIYIMTADEATTIDPSGKIFRLVDPDSKGPSKCRNVCGLLLDDFCWYFTFFKQARGIQKEFTDGRVHNYDIRGETYYIVSI